MEFRTRRELYNRCNPNESLEPQDPRNVDFDNFGSAEHRVRGVDWVERLAGRIELSDEAECELLTGLRGTGKSTELRRLAQYLGDSHRAHLLVVYFDAEEELDLTQSVDVPDILGTLLAATEARVLEAEGSSPDKALKDGAIRRLWNWLTGTEVQLKGAELALGGHGKVSLDFKNRPTLREQVRSAVSEHLGPFLRLVWEEMLLLEGRARKRGFQGLFLIFDSLEKLQGTSHNYDDVLRSAEQLFAGNAVHLKLPVHTLYTIPPALTARRAFHSVSFLPMVRIAEKDGTDWSPGYAALREMLRLRVKDEQLAQQLGPDFEEHTRRLIRWSGGYPRELVRLLQLLWTYSEPLTKSELDRLCSEVTDSYRKVIRKSDAQWLARVAREHYITTDNDAQQVSADRMLSSNAVLRYLNSEDWYDLHPAVRDVPEVRDAMHRLAASEAVETES